VHIEIVRDPQFLTSAGDGRDERIMSYRNNDYFVVFIIMAWANARFQGIGFNYAT
jgi:hypothetical protein